MKVNYGIWSWLTQAVIALVALAVLVLILMKYLPNIQQNERLRRELDRLQAEQNQQMEISRQLRAQIDALSHDPETVARLAREKLGYARPDETVVRFETPATNALP